MLITGRVELTDLPAALAASPNHHIKRTRVPRASYVQRYISI